MCLFAIVTRCAFGDVTPSREAPAAQTGGHWERRNCETVHTTDHADVDFVKLLAIFSYAQENNFCLSGQGLSHLKRKDL